VPFVKRQHIFELLPVSQTNRRIALLTPWEELSQGFF